MFDPLPPNHTSFGHPQPQYNLHFGTCTVSVPNTHEMGKLETPFFSWLADPTKHVLLQRKGNNARADWVASLDQRLRQTPYKRAMALFPGHGVSPDDACRRAAQIKVDLQYEGPIILFIWTVGYYLDYVKTKEGVPWSAPYAHQLLDLLCTHPQLENLDIFAHSLGADVSARGGAARRQNQQRPCYDNVILSAPDIDRRLFLRDLMAPLVSQSKQIILFYSSNDDALKAAQRITGYPRLGGGDGIPILPPIVTIDASRAPTDIFGFGHSYAASHREVLSITADIVRHRRSFDDIPLIERVPTPDGDYFELRR